MSEQILILSSPKHTKWSKLTKTSIETFWKNHPEILIDGEMDDRDWLSTAVSAVDKLTSDVVHLFLSDHALIGKVRPEGVKAVVQSLSIHPVVCYRQMPADKHGPGHILPVMNHECCLYPAAWRVKDLSRVLHGLDSLLVSPDQRSVANVDRLFHLGIVGGAAGITGNHNLIPLPVTGCLFQGKVDFNYAKHYEKRTRLLKLFHAAVSSWKPYEIEDCKTPLNGQVGRQKLMDELLHDRSFIIETGTHLGSTTRYLAKTAPVFSIEASEELLDKAEKNLRDVDNVVLVPGTSPEALQYLPNNSHEKVLAYLDAHSHGVSPFLREIHELTKRYPDLVIVIDDFEVPGTEYAYDPGLVISSLSTVSPSLHVYSPTYPFDQETGAKRGCVVLSTKPIDSKLLKRCN